MIQPVMEVTKEQIIKGSVLKNGAILTNQLFVYINDIVKISIVYWFKRLKDWEMHIDFYPDDEYEIGLVVDNNAFVMNKLVDKIKFETNFESDDVTTYLYLSIKEVNEFIQQVCTILEELDEKSN